MSVRWTLRPLALVCITAGLFACEHTTAPSEPAGAPPVRSVTYTGWGRALAPVSLPPTEGSDQVVHPDVVVTPRGALAHRWHLSLTPYPFGVALLENPFVFASQDGVTWLVEQGVQNPLARPRTNPAGELLSDPALVYVPESRELWLYYRSYTGDSDYVWLLRSSDAEHWSDPALLFATGEGQAVSPSIVHRSTGDWQMWTVNGHCGKGLTHIELRTSTDGQQWSAPQAVALDSLSPWHVFVRWVESLQLWVLLTNVKAKSGSCLTKDLYLASSADGVTWTHGSRPWLTAGEDSLGLFQSVVYRSAFVETGDSLRFFYSGATMTYRTYSCQGATTTCRDSSLHWSRLGTEIRPVTDVLRGATP